MSYFKLSEFDCKCGCGRNNTHVWLLNMLDTARDIAGTPFIINSGCRCEEHNKVVGSSSNNHTSGCAVDIKAEDSVTRSLILHGLSKAGFRRIGLHKSFIHADIMDTIGKPEACWFY